MPNGFCRSAASTASRNRRRRGRGADEDAGLRAEWGGNAARLVEAIGPAKFPAWFSGSAFEAGPPAIIKVDKPFAAEWIRATTAATSGGF